MRKQCVPARPSFQGLGIEATYTHPHFFMIAGLSTMVDIFSFPTHSELLSLLIISSVVYTSPELGIATCVIFCEGGVV